MTNELEESLAAKLKVLQERVLLLENDLVWTQKRLLCWEKLLWRCYDNLAPEESSLKEVIGDFLKESSIIELEIKAQIAQGGSAAVFTKKTGLRDLWAQSETAQRYRDQLDRLNSKNLEEVCNEFRMECYEMLCRCLQKEMDCNREN
jgi:hypothetical protein